MLRKLGSVLNGAEGAWKGILDQFAISGWPVALKKLGPEIAALAFLHIPPHQRHVATVGVNDGIRRRHAIYADLLAMPEEKSIYADACRLLMAHAFFAHLRILRIPTGTKLSGGLIKEDTSLEAYEAYTGREPWPALTISPRNLGLALRGLFSGEKWARAMMQEFPVIWIPMSFATCPEFEIGSEPLVARQSLTGLKEIRDSVRRYVAQAWGIKPRRRGHGRPIDLDAQEPAMRFDECPDEDEDDGEVQGEGQDEDPTSTDDSDQDQRGRKRKAHQVSRARHRRHGGSAGTGTDQAILASKFMANDKGRLAASELVILDVDARREFDLILAGLKNHCSDFKDDVGLPGTEEQHGLIEDAECTLFALVMLWTSSSIERTKNLLLAGSVEHIGANPFAVVLDANGYGRNAMIRVHTEWPPDAPRRGPMPLDRNRAQDARLADPAELGHMV